jgi:hypothetical protein
MSDVKNSRTEAYDSASVVRDDIFVKFVFLINLFLKLIKGVL